MVRGRGSFRRWTTWQLAGKVSADLSFVCYLDKLHQCLPPPIYTCCFLDNFVNRSALLALFLYCNGSHPRSETIIVIVVDKTGGGGGGGVT